MLGEARMLPASPVMSILMTPPVSGDVTNLERVLRDCFDVGVVGFGVLRRVTYSVPALS